ncbi:MAG: ABC transporter permease [Longimicrobiaceae bacterium]
MNTLLQDLRYALRQLGRGPGFAAVVVVTLALGIGANAAIFSLFEQVLLRPLPVHEPERLVNLGAPGPKTGNTSCNQAGECDQIFSYPMFRDLEAAQQSLTGLAAHRHFGANLATRNQTFSGGATLVSGSYFPVLGLQPALGRLLGPEDDRTVGAHPVAVLSYRFWETRLGADPAVLDQTLLVNGHPMTVVGVAPRRFEGTTLGQLPDVFVPLTMRGSVNPDITNPGFDDRRSYWVYLFGRLRPGVSLEQAQEGLNAIYRPIINEVEAPLHTGMGEQTMARFRAREVTLAEGWRGQSSFHGDARTPLLLLLGITGIVLLIACANIANLLLARGAGRQQEMAIRGSLGAGRPRLLGQLITESCLLALLGGAASLLVAHWTLRFIGSMLPAETAGILYLELQAPVLLFAAVLSLGTGLLFGIYPALHATRSDLVSGLKANSRQLSGARSATRFRNALVTAQIALSVSLLVFAGLFVQSLLNVSRVDLGLRAENLAAFDINPVLSGYEPAAARVLFERVEEELAAIPAVTSVSSGLVPLLRGDNWANDLTVEGFESSPDVDANASTNQIGPAYFQTVGIPLLAGREFTEVDDRNAPRVAIVNQAFARKFGLDERAVVGTRMAVGRGGELDIEIVGLVRDANYSEVKEPVPPQYFTPWRQAEMVRGLTYYARTATAPAPVMAAIPSVIRRLDPNLPVENLTTLEQQARESVFIDRMITTLSAAFAALATLLAALGLYGVMAYTVAQRTREIGVRIALGAGTGRVRAMILRQVGRVALVGGIIGIAAALALGRAAESLLFGIAGHDPWVVATGALLVGLVALAAGYIPARRATRVDPMVALRTE